MTVEAREEEFAVLCLRQKDGTLIDPLTREPVSVPSASRNREDDKSYEPKRQRLEPEEQIEEEIHEEAEAAITAVFEVEALARRSIHDIKLPPNQMALVCMSIVYEYWGLPDDEICMALNCSTSALMHIRQLDMYLSIKDSLIESVRRAYMASVDGIMQQASLKAAMKVAKLVGDKSSDIALSASKDVLDRSGHRPADKIEVTSKSETSLVIRVIKEREEDKLLNTIDLSANNG